MTPKIGYIYRFTSSLARSNFYNKPYKVIDIDGDKATISALHIDHFRTLSFQAIKDDYTLDTNYMFNLELESL